MRVIRPLKAIFPVRLCPIQIYGVGRGAASLDPFVLKVANKVGHWTVTRFTASKISWLSFLRLFIWIDSNNWEQRLISARI